MFKPDGDEETALEGLVGAGTEAISVFRVELFGLGDFGRRGTDSELDLKDDRTSWRGAGTGEALSAGFSS